MIKEKFSNDQTYSYEILYAMDMLHIQDPFFQQTY